MPTTGSRPTSRRRNRPPCGSAGPRKPGPRSSWPRRIGTSEAVPEVRAAYAWVAARPVETMPAADLAETWDEVWERIGRCWSIHFYAIRGPYQVLEDLADLYESVIEAPAPGEALGLIGGGDPRTAGGRARPRGAGSARGRGRRASRSAWPSPASPSTTLATPPDAGPFARRSTTFLAEHGHLGQNVDDLTLASWAEEPGLLLAELAKRVRTPGRRSARRNGVCDWRPRRTGWPTGRAALAGDPAGWSASRNSSPPPARSAISPRPTTTGSTGWPRRRCAASSSASATGSPRPGRSRQPATSSTSVVTRSPTSCGDR